MTRTLDHLCRLIAFPTVSHDSNLALIDWAQALLADAGFTVTRIAAPCGTKAGLYARIGPDAAGGVCLSAHTDVVPVEGQVWTRPAFELTQQDGRVFGRGTTDMKGFLASVLAMAERVVADELAAPLSIVLSYDEEVGCVGIRQMMPALAPLLGTPRAVIVGEPTGMQVATGHKGKAALQVICEGDAGHSALAPQFVNAIHVAARFVDEMRAVQVKLAKGPQDEAYDIPFSTVHVGRIAGGRALNIVPDLVTLEMEYRHLPEVSGETIRALIEAAGQRAGQALGRTEAVKITEVNTYPGLDVTAESLVTRWSNEMTGGTGCTKVAFGTEAGFFAGLGLDTVVIGPGDMAADGHKPDEGLALAQLDACDKMLARVLADLQR